MAYTSPPTLVESRNKFFSTILEAIRQGMQDEGLLEHVEGFEVIPSSKDAIRNLDDDWNVVTVEEAAGYKKGKKKRAAK